MIRLINSIFFIFIGMVAVAQTADPARNNRSVFNKVEFFLNAQLSDSLYQMASPAYQQQVTLDRLAYQVQQLSFLGRIQEVKMDAFEDNIAHYTLSYAKQRFKIVFAVDSTMRFHTFGISPDEKPAPAAVVAPSAQAPLTSSAPTSDPLRSLVDKSVAQHLALHPSVSLSIGLIRNDQKHSFFYGETQKGNKTLPTATSRYSIGSLTQLFTATLLANLVEQNIVQLGDSIVKFLPDSVAKNPDLHGITLGALANHSAGFPLLPENLQSSPSYLSQNPYAHYNVADLYDFLKNYKAAAVPGEAYSYSHTGYAVLGQILVQLYKKSFSEAAHEIIFKPLGMVNTVDKADKAMPYALSNYAKDGTEVIPWNYQALEAAGSMSSSVEDLLAFASVQFNLPETAIQQALAQTRQFTFFAPPMTDIGLAWQMDMLEDGLYVHQHSQTLGSNAYIALSPDSKTAIVVLSNSGHDISELAKAIFEQVLNRK